MAGRLPRVTGAEVVRALERTGWVVVRVRGSHFIMQHPDRPGLPVVPRHAGRVVKPGTLKDILTEAGLSVEELRSLLWAEDEEMRYTVVLVPDPELGGYVAYVPVVGVTTQGESIDDALAMAAEAAGLKLDVLADDGEELPVEHPGAIFTSVEVTLGESVPVGAGVTATAGDARVPTD